MEKYGAIDKSITPPHSAAQQDAVKTAADLADELERLADSPEQRLAKQAQAEQERRRS